LKYILMRRQRAEVGARRWVVVPGDEFETEDAANAEAASLNARVNDRWQYHVVPVPE